MKQLINAMPQRIAMLVCGLILSVSAFAQQIVVKGHVKDARRRSGYRHRW